MRWALRTILIGMKNVPQTDFLNAIRSSDIMAGCHWGSPYRYGGVGQHDYWPSCHSFPRPIINLWGWDRPIPLCHSVNEEDVLNWLLKLAEDKKFL